MIAFLNGICAEVLEDRVLVDVNGVGFEVFAPLSALGEMPGSGEPLRLHTFMSVREDGMTLYGFFRREELSVFRMLIGVSGIGPKGALGLLSTLGADDLRFAILAGDVKALSRAPGIGKRTAERLVVELKDRFSAERIREEDLEALQGTEREEALRGAPEEAAAALAALGYGMTDATRAVRSALRKEGALGNDTEALLKAALKEII